MAYTTRSSMPSTTTNGVGAGYSKINKISYVTGGTDSNQVLSINRTDSSTFSGVTDPTSAVITNVGTIPAIVMLGYEGYTDETSDTAVIYQHALLLPGESIQPPLRAIISLQGSNTTSTNGSFADRSLWNLDTTALDWTAPSDDLYVDSTANVDDGSGLDIIGQAAETKLFLEPYTSAANCTANMFRIGDIIRVNNEIMEVMAIGDKSDLANNYLTVRRGLYGSTAASDHADTAAVRFPYFNTYHEFDKFTSALAPGATAGYCQTDDSGRYASKNFFGLGRNLGTAPSGIQPGSVCLRFYEQGTQEVGAQNLSSSTNSGLDASTAYAFNITVNGGTEKQSLSFTTDSSNVNFGGTNGVISKMQAALDAEYYDESSNLFETKVTIGLVGGDIVFRSHNNLSTSAILLANPTSGTTPWGKGRFRAAASMKTAIPARVPEGSDLTVYDPITYQVSKSSSKLAYDMGDGTIVGFGGISGNINYETGAWSISGAPANANFEYSVINDTVFSGKRDAQEATRANSLTGVWANVMNLQMEGSIKVELH